MRVTLVLEHYGLPILAMMSFGRVSAAALPANVPQMARLLIEPLAGFGAGILRITTLSSSEELLIVFEYFVSIGIRTICSNDAVHR